MIDISEIDQGSIPAVQLEGPGYSPGPFSLPQSPHCAALRPYGLRATSQLNQSDCAFSLPKLSLFSVLPAGSLGGKPCIYAALRGEGLQSVN
ncbi:hypothetical protein [Nitrosomonas aestuarii]|uniref:hypothetical protein n=1 Tax=Nitrosomonas aestuarii TaxID=52441 RepID=UPI000D2FFAB8|nr:hypothetical protein [Nitrosomonas aestuarii]PTN10767.1 hypothetical protein C8R11_11810 [Nitrosomonas aestuarii]